MKIRCEFCGNRFNDMLDECPYCGAPSSGVRRSESHHPKTIEELKAWYEAKGLPPAETTRFFIGIDYKKPRAFGIYKDPENGNFIVYKNKENGSRALRYEGTDEAYAVNELYQRLYQEIILQKSRQLNEKKNGGGQKKNGKKKKSLLGIVISFLLFGFLVLIVLPAALILIIGSVIIASEPKTGYYDVNGQIYYYSGDYKIEDYESDTGFIFEDGEWSEPLNLDGNPIFGKRKTCKAYYVCEEWTDQLSCTDFGDTVWAKDIEAGFYHDQGYYRYDETVYYHLAAYYRDKWYRFDKTWEPILFEDLPKELQHPSLSEACFEGKDSTLIRTEDDFFDTVYYADSLADDSAAKGYYRVEDDYYYHLADAYDDGWYAYENEDWTAAEAADLPEELQHPSQVEDFYYLDAWDGATQFTDFTETEVYKNDKDIWENDDDSGSSWSSSDSWDSGSTDFSSDW